MKEMNFETLTHGFLFTLVEDGKESQKSAREYLDGIDWKKAQAVRIPHDWAISGDFDIKNDAVYNEEGVLKFTGRTGGLPIVGVGVYRKEIEIPKEDAGKCIFVEFDGVMNQSEIFWNGKKVGSNHFGYFSFNVDVTDAVEYGKVNVLEVVAISTPNSSRWYPGAGIFRQVRLVKKEKTHIVYNGTRLIAVYSKSGDAFVNVTFRTAGNAKSTKVEIVDANGKTVAEFQGTAEKADGILPAFTAWDIENPYLYTANVTLLDESGKEADGVSIRFGVREVKMYSDRGLFLNGRHIKLKGACMHHDLGLLGAAFNRSAAKRQLEKLQEMGLNALRTSHNPPAPQLLDLCDEMGILVMDEFFDEWVIPKCKNGYNKFFNEHAESDIAACIDRDANHPSVFIWSVGNEIPEQVCDYGWQMAERLNLACHKADNTRPTTLGTNRSFESIPNHFMDHVDVVGLNYKCRSYAKFHYDHPEYILFGSETESSWSSRGEYKLPVVYEDPAPIREDRTVTAYEVSANKGAYIPEREFAQQEILPYVLGNFTWTGFDYLGEPCPYDVEWPSRSAYFGIFDLAGLPKDRYWLFKSQWTKEPILHLFPHWNWENTGVEKLPVHCFTSFDRVELFVNGKSMGVKKKRYGLERELEQFRMIWEDVPYEAGELKAVAYNKDGSVAAEEIIRTAGEPKKVVLNPEKSYLPKEEAEILFVRVSVVDENGVECPKANNYVKFTAENAIIHGSDNGDQRDLNSLSKPERALFNGLCVVAVETDGSSKALKLTAKSEGLESAELILEKR